MRDMFRLPSRRDWQSTGLAVLIFSALALPFGWVSGLYVWSPMPEIWAVVRLALIAFVLPAICEELVFRGPLIWMQSDRGSAPRWAIAASLAAFLVWHPLNTLLFMPEASELFRDWRFLLVAFWLGIVATMLALRSGTLWSAILFHWSVVVGWKAVLDNPAFYAPPA